MKLLCNIALAVLLAGALFGQMPKGPGLGGPGGRHPMGGGPRPGKRPGPSAIEKFNSLPPDQREQMLGKMPPERRKLFEERIDRYNQMSPGEKKQLQDQFDRFRKLPPEQQEEARRVFRRFNSQPEDRQKAMRDEMDSLRKLSPEERRQKMNSADYEERFSLPERRMMRDLDKAFEEAPPHDQDDQPI